MFFILDLQCLSTEGGPHFKISNFSPPNPVKLFFFMNKKNLHENSSSLDRKKCCLKWVEDPHVKILELFYLMISIALLLLIFSPSAYFYNPLRWWDDRWGDFRGFGLTFIVTRKSLYINIFVCWIKKLFISHDEYSCVITKINNLSKKDFSCSSLSRPHQFKFQFCHNF